MHGKKFNQRGVSMGGLLVICALLIVVAILTRFSLGAWLLFALFV